MVEGVFIVIAQGGAQFVEAASFDLTDAFSREIKEDADIFEGDAAAVGDIQGTGFGQFPDFEVGEVHFDGAGLRNDVEVQMVFARYPGAGSWRVSAVASGDRTELFEGLEDELCFFDLLARQPTHRERFGATQPATRTASGSRRPNGSRLIRIVHHGKAHNMNDLITGFGRWPHSVGAMPCGVLFLLE